MGPSRWDRLDLVRRLCRVLGIAARSVERLGSSGYQDSIEPANNLPAEKLITETAFLLVLVASVPHADNVAQRADHVARLLIPHARSDRMRLGLCLRPALAWDYALAHLCLRRLGYPDRSFDALLWRSLSAQAAEGRERVPHRVLEIEWMRRLLAEMEPDAAFLPGAEASTARCTSATLQSVLNHPIDLFGATREDIYAFTHAVMYSADASLRRGQPRPREALLAEAEAAFAGALDSEDYDIGGELLLTWPLMHAPWSAAATFGFRVLADVEDLVGFLPAAATRLDRLNALRGEARGEYLTATAYHTAYVMGLLCAAALARDNQPPVRVPLDRAIAGSATAIAPFLDDGSRRRHWQDSYEELAPSEQDAVSGLLLAIALHRRVAGRDFAAVMELLSIADSFGLANTPVASQAAELLDRLAVFSRGTLADRRCPSALLTQSCPTGSA